MAVTVIDLNKNLGLSAARNTDLEACRSSNIAYFDADTLLSLTILKI